MAMKSSCQFVFNHSGPSELNYKLCLGEGGLMLYSRGTENAENTSHVIAKQCYGVTSLRIPKLHGHKENTVAVLLFDVTAYAEVSLPSRCLETGCITPLFYCCVPVLLSNGCFCGSTVLPWSK
jgi:hypothetical protein